MATRKMGESQNIDFFSTALRNELLIKFGKNAAYSIGNFSGSQDRKFADFFAGTCSSCILIEFKEFSSEISDEQKKPLREKLCQELSIDTALLSRSSHFIAYRSPKNSMQIQLAPYVDVVCPLFSIGIPPLARIQTNQHTDFIDDFLSGTKGTAYDNFLRYVGHLNTTAGGIANGSAVPFKSILYSRNVQGKVIGTIFDSLGELRKLLNLSP
ncbi:MAG: hypothetical protein NTV43_12090 [Methylococcales bacterium]|nr:hypothetical protein [Methylococcales bacterium]